MWSGIAWIYCKGKVYKPQPKLFWKWEKCNTNQTNLFFKSDFFQKFKWKLWLPSASVVHWVSIFRHRKASIITAYKIVIIIFQVHFGFGDQSRGTHATDETLSQTPRSDVQRQVAHQQHPTSGANKSLMSENTLLREHLDRERFRRKVMLIRNLDYL